MKKKVLIAVGSASIGGAEKQIATLAKFINNKYACRVLFLAKGGPLERNLSEENIERTKKEPTLKIKEESKCPSCKALWVHKAEECAECGFKERRVLDYKMPLILHFKDKNKKNYRQENI